MKKLMIATAALCAAVGVNAIESANVVGYQEVEAPTGDSMRCPTFKMVGGAGYDLTKITVTGGYGIGDIVAQTIGSDGIWVGEYYWLDEVNAGVPVTGWYKDMGGSEAVAVGEVVLDQGQGFALHSDYEDLQLKVSGEVPAGDVPLTFVQGDGMLGNALPQDADLTDITVTGGYGIGDIVAQAIGADGVWNGEYYWLDEVNAGVPATGWYKDMGGSEAVMADEVVLAPGEALSIHSDYEDLTFTLPAVL